MYEYINGTIAESSPAHVVLDVSGVGYYLHISLQTYAAVEGQDRAKLYVHHVVREDAQLLYGFHTRGERELFRHLISVSGVGVNTARMILSTYSPGELRNIIATENAVLLKNVKGLGLKTAQKIIVELSGRMTGLESVSEGSGADLSASADRAGFDETLAALVMLGFPKGAAEKVVKTVYADSPSISVEEAVRAALKRL